MRYRNVYVIASPLSHNKSYYCFIVERRLSVNYPQSHVHKCLFIISLNLIPSSIRCFLVSNRIIMTWFSSTFERFNSWWSTLIDPGIDQYDGTWAWLKNWVYGCRFASQQHQPFLSHTIIVTKNGVFELTSRTEENGLALTERQLLEQKLIPIRITWCVVYLVKQRNRLFRRI